MEYGSSQAAFEINVHVSPFGMNDLGFLLVSLGNRSADQGMEPILSISTFDISFDLYICYIHTSVMYLIFVPFVVFPALTYFFIYISKCLNWVYIIFICFLGVPKLSSANLAPLFFCMCGNCVRVL